MITMDAMISVMSSFFKKREPIVTTEYRTIQWSEVREAMFADPKFQEQNIGVKTSGRDQARIECVLSGNALEKMMTDQIERCYYEKTCSEVTFHIPKNLWREHWRDIYMGWSNADFVGVGTYFEDKNVWSGKYRDKMVHYSWEMKGKDEGGDVTLKLYKQGGLAKHDVTIEE